VPFSFSLCSLPVLSRKSLTGSVNSLSIDIKNGYFGGSAALTQDDYGATPTQSNIASFIPPSRDSDCVTTTLPISALGSWPPVGGLLQFRLRASTPIDFKSDLLELFSSSDPIHAPALLLTY
jgi:hypothetical protein